MRQANNFLAGIGAPCNQTRAIREGSHVRMRASEPYPEVYVLDIAGLIAFMVSSAVADVGHLASHRWREGKSIYCNARPMAGPKSHP
jgi:hypothetical protein